MGKDIGYDEVIRFRKLLTGAIKVIVKKDPADKKDSPVYTFLNNLKAPEIATGIQEAIQNTAGEK